LLAVDEALYAVSWANTPGEDLGLCEIGLKA
jgi:hypothetical protein